MVSAAFSAAVFKMNPTSFATLFFAVTFAGAIFAADSAVPVPGRRMRTDIAVPSLPTTTSAKDPAVPVVALPPLPEGVAELRFEDFFKMPIGPRGLEVTDKLRALDGKRVRVFGYMVHEEIEAHGPLPTDAGSAETGVVPDRLMLTAAPQMVSFADFALSEDLPPQVVFVTLAEKTGAVVPFTSRPLLLTGILSVGRKPEPEGRVSLVRLKLDLDPTPATTSAPAAARISASPTAQLSPVQSTNHNPTR